MEDKNKNDDFFSLLEKDEKIENPFASDEILFQDEKGNLKIIKGGEILDFAEKSEPEVEQKPAEEVAVSSVAEREIVGPAKIPAQVAEPPVPLGKPLDVEKEIEIIVEKSKLELFDQEQVKRFKNIIRSRLKGARDQIQTKQMLIGPDSFGGLGVSPETADRILAIISQESEKLNGRLRDEVSSEPFSDLHSEIKQILTQPSSLAPEPKEIERPKMVFKPVVDAPLKPEEIKLPEIKPVEIKKEPSITEPPQVSRPIMNTNYSKPRIEDVKFRPKLTGPVEEIRTMTLADFRRLAPTAEGIIDKIMEKIDLLEEESFSKRIEGIKAWKESEVNRIYLELGEESMENKKPIAEIIKERQQLNQPTLTEEEVENIIELNQKLRY